MSRTTYPFPLAVNSSAHSDYHRFLLGAEPEVLAPLPKPACIGALSEQLPDLCRDLNLAKWRKLYHASFPWNEGFGSPHYGLGNVAAYRPLPEIYGRPARRFGAYDFVTIADASVSALALIGGDDRVLLQFLSCNADFCRRIETGAAGYRPNSGGTAHTGRALAGQFAEPNNRWLMPLLHVHNRFLNFTSFADRPAQLCCIDSSELAKAGRRARTLLPGDQANRLRDLGYVAEFSADSAALRVRGVSERLLAAMEAPRIAVLRLLERMLGENGGSVLPRFGDEAGTATVAAMADRLESMINRSLSFYRPPKIALPSAGPWKNAVRANLAEVCPEDLAELDRAAMKTGAAMTLFTAPPLDHGHRHVPAVESFAAREQQGADSDLVLGPGRGPPEPQPCLWLASQYEETLHAVRASIRLGRPESPYRSYRQALLQMDQCTEDAGLDVLKQADRTIESEVERRAKVFSAELAKAHRPPREPDRTLEIPGRLLADLPGPEVPSREFGGISR